jgi:signal recognition particle receptor subunit beta
VNYLGVVEKLGLHMMTFTSWDVGGRHKLRPVWRTFYAGLDGLIFFVDSNDCDRIEEAYDELNRMITDDELQNIPLLIFANKMDLPNAMPPNVVTECLRLHSITNRKWHLQPCVATTGEGLGLGFQWLVDTLNMNERPKWLKTLDHSECAYSSDVGIPLLK